MTGTPSTASGACGGVFREADRRFPPQEQACAGPRLRQAGNLPDSRPASIRRQVEEGSMRRLRTGHVDLLAPHGV